MDDETRSEVLQMWDQGMSANAIADELGVSSTTVRNVVRASGRDTKKPRTHAHEREIVEQYVNGGKVPDILAKYGVSYTQLYNMLSRNDVPIRKAANAQGRGKQLDAAVILYQQNVAVWKITEETGVAQPTLHAELHRREIPLRRPRRSQ